MDDVRAKDLCQLLNSGKFKIPMIVIYEKPKDYPNHFVARVWDCDRPTNAIMLKESLEAIRSEMPYSLIRINRSEKDDNCIIETWV